MKGYIESGNNGMDQGLDCGRWVWLSITLRLCVLYVSLCEVLASKDGTIARDTDSQCGTNRLKWRGKYIFSLTDPVQFN